MRDNAPKYCKATGKYCYSSEAKAIRAKNRYEDIKRVYYCKSCEHWHTTSMGIGLALKEGLIKKKKKKKPASAESIQRRLEFLKNKEKEKEERRKNNE